MKTYRLVIFKEVNGNLICENSEVYSSYDEALNIYNEKTKNNKVRIDELENDEFNCVVKNA